MFCLTDNPISRYPKDRPLDEDLGRWAVVHVRSRQEQAFAHDLFDWNVPYYFPMVLTRTRRRDNGKVRKSLLPLFPGYVAISMNQETKSRIYATNRIVSIIPVADQRQFVDELLQVQRAINGNMKVALQPSFTAAQPVRIRSGPLAGLKGEVAQCGCKMIFVVWVHMFQRAVRVELDEADIEAL